MAEKASTLPKLLWISHGSAEYAAAVTLRRAILRWPLGLDFTPAELAAEAVEQHLGLFQEGKLWGTLVLRPLSGASWQMRQVAVAGERQGFGWGRLLVREGECRALALGGARLVLHARETVVAFYEKLGYQADGDPFEEVTLIHRAMSKELVQPALIDMPSDSAE